MDSQQQGDTPASTEPTPPLTNTDNAESGNSGPKKQPFRFIPRVATRFRSRISRPAPTTQQQSSLFTQIPDKVLKQIFTLSSKKDLQSYCLVCQKWRDVLWEMATEVCNIY